MQALTIMHADDADEMDTQLEAEMEAALAESATPSPPNETSSTAAAPLEESTPPPSEHTRTDGSSAVGTRQKRPRPRQHASGAHEPVSPPLPPSAAPLPPWASASASDDDVGYMWGMNIVTGRMMEEDSSRAKPRHEETSAAAAPERKTLVQLSYGSYRGVQLSSSELRRIKAQECAQMLRQKKLVLVLDLDHTLLNSISLHELVDPKLQAALRERYEQGPPSQGREAAEEGDASPKENHAEAAGSAVSTEKAGGVEGEGGASEAAAGGRDPLLHFLADIHMWTKLRPSVHDFLRGAAEHFELYVYTMGTKAYAARMVTLLDPHGELGLKDADRVIGREDSTAGYMKGLDVVLGSDRTILILDDSPAVWPNEGSRLLVPRRYIFFPTPGGKHEQRGHLMSGTDEGEHDQLHHLLRVLREIHAHYFEHLLPTASPLHAADDCPNVSSSVSSVRRRVLAGQRLLFTHVIPLQQQGTPEAHAAGRLAIELGATIALDTSPEVTHVVAGADNTDKVKWAREKGIPVVSVEWLYSCGYLWAKVEEARYPISSQTAGAESRDFDQMRLLPPPQLWPQMADE